MNTHQNTSQFLIEISEQLEKQEEFTLGKLLSLLSYRSFGVGILIFSLPSILPFSVVPGVSAIFALPILLLSLQLALMKKNPWFPMWLKNKKINTKKFQTFLTRAVQYVQYIEKMVKPRYFLFCSSWMQIFLGILLACLSILLMLPIPFSNMIFGSLIALIAIALIESDGLMLLIFSALGSLTVIFFYKAFLLLFALIK